MHSISIKGFTLIETLVALLILSIGLLGMAGLQIVSLQSSNGALSRSQATMLSYDLVERIRRNPEQIDYYKDSLDTKPESTNCISTTCTAEQLAQEDLFQWSTELDQAIPGAIANMTDKDNQYTLSISWNESQFGNNNINMSYDMTFEL
ncbi:type IV pilus modification protein PilV [Endozoicomonas acroporae]|uniref:type IV pilus modification protein PilV n=1 Tax=Endozoicomonas acroporae TaxID=1701104 RepID=UPI003D7B00D6